MDKEVAAEKIKEILEMIGSKGVDDYQRACKKTAKLDFKSPREELLTWGLGISGCAGDVASRIQKTITQDQDQKEKIKENLGDVLWYVSMICNFFEWELRDIMDYNLEKVRKRYPNGFTHENVSGSGVSVDWGGN